MFILKQLIKYQIFSFFPKTYENLLLKAKIIHYTTYIDMSSV